MPNRGGVMTLVRDAWLKDNDMAYFKLSLGRDSRHTIRTEHGPPLVLYNAHIEDEDHSANVRVALFTAVLEDARLQHGFVIIAGDFNHDDALALEESPYAHRALMQTRARVWPTSSESSLPVAAYLCWFCLFSTSHA